MLLISAFHVQTENNMLYKKDKTSVARTVDNKCFNKYRGSPTVTWLCIHPESFTLPGYLERSVLPIWGSGCCRALVLMYHVVLPRAAVHLIDVGTKHISG